MFSHFNIIMISVTLTMLVVLAFTIVNNSQTSATLTEDSSAYTETKMPELLYYDKYSDLRNDGKVVVIYPIFTQSAYAWGGFHDYYEGRCDFCITTKLESTYEKTFSASGNGFRILEFLGYQVIDDIDIDKDPSILDKYDKVILLHNEFVTKSEFEAITHHPNVVYLYPGSLLSEVTANYNDNTITLVRGPKFPSSDITSGFDWNLDNSKYFNDWDCSSWEFNKVSNGYMLNCYPETFLPNNGYEMLKALKSL